MKDKLIDLLNRQAKHREDARQAVINAFRKGASFNQYKPMSERKKAYLLKAALLLFIIILAWIFLK